MTTQDISSVITKLRNLLMEDPSEGLWSQICDLLSFLNRKSSVPAVDYVVAHTGHWPAGLRVAPDKWIKNAAKGKEPRLRTVDSLTINELPEGMSFGQCLSDILFCRVVDREYSPQEVIMFFLGVVPKTQAVTNAMLLLALFSGDDPSSIDSKKVMSNINNLDIFLTDLEKCFNQKPDDGVLEKFFAIKNIDYDLFRKSILVKKFGLNGLNEIKISQQSLSALLEGKGNSESEAFVDLRIGTMVGAENTIVTLPYNIFCPEWLITRFFGSNKLSIRYEQVEIFNVSEIRGYSIEKRNASDMILTLLQKQKPRVLILDPGEFRDADIFLQADDLVALLSSIGSMPSVEILQITDIYMGDFPNEAIDYFFGIDYYKFPNLETLILSKEDAINSYSDRLNDECNEFSILTAMLRNSDILHVKDVRLDGMHFNAADFRYLMGVTPLSREATVSIRGQVVMGLITIEQDGELLWGAEDEYDDDHYDYSDNYHDENI